MFGQIFPRMCEATPPQEPSCLPNKQKLLCVVLCYCKQVEQLCNSLWLPVSVAPHASSLAIHNLLPISRLFAGCRPGPPAQLGIFWESGKPQPGLHQCDKCLCWAPHQTAFAQAAEPVVNSGECSAAWASEQEPVLTNSEIPHCVTTRGVCEEACLDDFVLLLFLQGLPVV